MPRPPIDLHRKLREILTHAEPLPLEAESPIAHYRRSGDDLFNLLLYVERNFARAGTTYPAVRDRHLGRLHSMLAVHLIESFERFLKEAAAVCVDEVAGYVLDSRYDKFRVKGSALAIHFRTGTFGRAICESSTWFDLDEVNERYKAALADPFEGGTFELFPYPGVKKPTTDQLAQRAQYETLELVWQLRHTIVHNVGVLTQSDAIKFRLMVRTPVPLDRVLALTRDDVRYLKRFLDETVQAANKKVGTRLTEVLTTLHAGDSTLFAPQDVADRLSRTFDMLLQVAGVTGAQT